MRSSSVRSAVAGVALAVSASLAGCHSHEAPAPAPAPSATGSPGADLFASPDDFQLPSALVEDAGPAPAGGDLAAESGRDLAIVLKDAGAEPRAPLRYDFAVGTPQTLVLNVTSTVKRDGEPGGQEGDTPPLRLTLSVIAGGKPSADKTVFQVHVTKAEVAPGTKGIPPEAAAQMSELSKALEGIAATVAVSTQGVLQDAELSGSPEAQAAASSLLPLIENALDLLFVPVPGEAVGVGAQWTVASAGAPGVPGSVIVKTYVLKARTAATATVHEDQHEEAPEQPIRDPDAPPGATMAMVSKEASTLTVRWAAGVSKASSEEDTVMTARDTGSSPPKVVVTHVKRSVRLEGK